MVWNEYNTGINGKKALRFYSIEDKTNVSRSTLRKREEFGLAMTLLLERGLTLNAALTRISTTYRAATNINAILDAVLKDNKARNLQYLQAPPASTLKNMMRYAETASKLTVTAAKHAAVNTPTTKTVTITTPNAAAKMKSPMKRAAPVATTKKTAPKKKAVEKVTAKKVVPVIDLIDSPEEKRVRSGRATTQKMINYADYNTDDEEDI
jgi:hypothetical protein